MVRLLLVREGERLIVRLVREGERWGVVLVERWVVGRVLASNLVVGSLVM